MKKSVIIHAETISIVAKGTEKPLGHITIKKTVFEHPERKDLQE